MARGFLLGAVTGLVTGAVALATLSLLGEQPAGSRPPAPMQVEAPAEAGVPGDAAAPDAALTGGADSGAPAGPTPAPAADAAPDAPPLADDAPAEAPEAAPVASALIAPGDAAAPGLAASGEEPVLPNPQAAAPLVPETEPSPAVSTAPAEPPLPDPDGGSAAPMPADPVAPQAGILPAPVDPGAPALVILEGATENPMPSGTAAVTINRPAQPETAAGTGEAAPAAAAGTADALPTEPAAPALRLHAAAFENPGNLPLLAIVLIDDGSMAGGPAALAAAPFPVTVAIPFSRADAAAALQAYRAAGIEVAVIARLPAGGTPADAEVTLATVFAALPQTVALLDDGTAGLQSGRAMTDQVMAILAGAGRGVITISTGLNMALAAAEEAAVPAAVIYRDLDAEGQDARVIRRFLDQAAFRARQESGVVLLGRVRPDTISALMLWGAANAARQVAVAPVSAVLQAR